MPVAILAFGYSGDPATGQSAIASLRAVADPIGDGRRGVAVHGVAAGPRPAADTGREPHVTVNMHTRWRDPVRACGLFDALSPHSASHYVNSVPADDAGRVAEAFGANFARLAAIKARYDPENRFRLNQNIAPAAPERLAG